ncbi:MAG: SGNH/GDSL hydrolase family protein [Roseinatronobacter sp.]
MNHAIRTFAVSPILICQLLGIVLRARRLPEPEGSRSGVLGQGPTLRLLILGDSSAAGVGVTTQESALSGQVISRLAPFARVEWALIARSGATTRRARELLKAKTAQFDVAILALGVNDVLRHTRLSRFRDAQTGLMQDLRERYGVRSLLVSSVPPLGAFPIFPVPLRTHLGGRARKLDRVLQEVCREQHARHIPFSIKPDACWLASDGLHPGRRLYEVWGARMAGLALEALS